jgi:hypothetical protein
MEIPWEDGMTASGHCGEDWGVEVPGEDGMTASGHCGEDWGGGTWARGCDRQWALW